MEQHTNCADYVLKRIESRGAKSAQIDSKTGKKISYRDICVMVENVADHFKMKGIGHGSVVGICLENSLEYIGILLGILKVGATAALLSPSLKSRELNHLISVMKPTILYAPKLNSEQQDVIRSFPQISLVNLSLEEILKSKIDFKKTSPNENEKLNDLTPAILFSSSGSTGLPKAVSITHKNIISSFQEISGKFMKEGDAALGLMPFFHAFGFGLLIMSLCEGSPLVIMSKYSQEEFCAVIVNHEIVLLHVVASFMNKLVSFNSEFFKNIKAIYTGAGAVSPKVQGEVLAKLGTGAKMYHTYGMSETTHVITCDEVRSDKPGSSGRIFPFMKAKVVGACGETLAAGKKGELCLSGPMIMSGYYCNPKSTEETFTDDGWLKTGDLVWVDEDGYVYIVDRIKDIIKFQGYQVSVTEIEQVIIELPGVQEVAVVGVPHKVYGEVPRAFVVLDESKKPTKEQIDFAVNSELSYYKWLRGGIRFIDSLPKTPSMKINKKPLRSLP